MTVLEDDPDKINDPDRALESKVVAKAESYQASRLRSQRENKIKADGRKEIDKLGFRTDAYQSALRVARDLTLAEQRQYVRDFRYFLKIFGARQQELWPEDAAKAEARAKRKRERLAKAAAAAGKETPEQQERRLAADTNPRSDPKNGGAGRKRKPKADGTLADTVKAGDALIADTAAKLNTSGLSAVDVAAEEQQVGGEILDGALEQMKGKPSQSEVAKDKLQKAGLA